MDLPTARQWHLQRRVPGRWVEEAAGDSVRISHAAIQSRHALSNIPTYPLGLVLLSHATLGIATLKSKV